MAQKKHHDVPAKHMVGGPADDETGHKALSDGLEDGERQHVDSQFGPSNKSRKQWDELRSYFCTTKWELVPSKATKTTSYVTVG